jgi:hypothetical protein
VLPLRLVFQTQKNISTVATRARILQRVNLLAMKNAVVRLQRANAVRVHQKVDLRVHTVRVTTKRVHRNHAISPHHLLLRLLKILQKTSSVLYSFEIRTLFHKEMICIYVKLLTSGCSVHVLQILLHHNRTKD